MQRNLMSNRQLRAFNALLTEKLGESNAYLNAMPLGRTRDTAIEWIELDLEAGDAFVFCYASDKPWFHRCGLMRVYCGIKGESLEDSIEYSLDIINCIREWGYEVEENPSASLIRSFNVRFNFPRWHEIDRATDVLDEIEISLFPDVETQQEPYVLGMTGDWFNESADQFFQESQVEGRQKNCIFNECFLDSEMLTGYARWSRSLPNAFATNTGCTISYHDESGQTLAQTDFLPIGTYSKVSNTFAWSWENPGWLKSYQLTEELRACNPQVHDQLIRIRSLSKDLGFVEFTESGEITVEEFESWEFANMACKVLEADATFMLPGDYGNTYGLLFYRDMEQRSFTQAAIKRLSRWRRSMQEYLNRDCSLYDESSIRFAHNFLASDSGAELEREFVQAIGNEQFRSVLLLRSSDDANEERRFKQTLKCMLIKHGYSPTHFYQ